MTETSPSMATRALQVVQVPSARVALSELVAWSAESPADPFVADAVVTPGPGHQRWVSQGLAAAHGICTGVDFLSLAALRRRVAQALDLTRDEHDPWRAAALTLTLDALLADLPGAAWAQPLKSHLQPRLRDGQRDARLADRPGRRFATAGRVAQLFARYWTLAPTMVDAWSAGDPVDPWGQPLAASARWQFELWQQVRDALGDDHPQRTHQQLVERAAQADLPWPRLGVLAVGTVPQADRELLAALGDARAVTLWQVDATGSAPTASLQRVGRQLRRQREAWAAQSGVDVRTVAPAAGASTTLLGRLQASVRGLVDPSSPRAVADGTVVLHGCHGPSRQVEVLRDALCGLLADDPTLEPRDVVVVCPDLTTYAPLLTASFGGHTDHATHPGHGLRVQVPAADGSANPVLDLLADVLALVRGRARATDLLAFCATAPVQATFGFDTDDQERLAALVGRGRIRWGLDRPHRDRWGLGHVAQGTWQNGVERLVTGSVLAEEPLTWLDTAAPVADLEPSDLRLAGLLAEVVSRMRKVALQARIAAPVETWADRLAEIIDLFGQVGPAQAWQASTARAAVKRWATAAGATQAELDLASVAAVVDDLRRTFPRRPSFGNGSLQVVDLSQLRAVPHRVVAVLGLDDTCFPARAPHVGDDLLALPPDAPETPVDARLAEADPRARSQAALLDAIMAAESHLLVTYQRFDERTNESLEPPVGVSEIAGALAPLLGVVNVLDGEHGAVAPLHPLQAHDNRNFRAGDPFSFDRSALAGAWAVVERHDHPLPDAPDPCDWTVPAPHDRTVALGDLMSFFRHPAKALLQHGVGTSLVVRDDDPEVQLPTDLWGLSEYQVGDALLRRVRDGVDVERAVTLARLEGDVPPPGFAEGKLNDLRRLATTIARQEAAVAGVPTDQVIDTELEGCRLTGVVRVRGRQVVDVSFGKVNGASVLEVWLQLLALAAAQPGPWRARIIRKDVRSLELEAPSQSAARTQLARFLHWRDLGLSSVFVAPPKTLLTRAIEDGLRIGGTRSRGPRELGRAWRTERDANWEPFTPVGVHQLMGARVHRELPHTVAQLVPIIFDPISERVVR